MHQEQKHQKGNKVNNKRTNGIKGTNGMQCHCCSNVTRDATDMDMP
jgi:hypothetical protein